MLEYQPISCDLYSHYELSIMHAEVLQLHWIQHGMDRIETLTPINLRTKNKAEFLIVRNNRGTLRVIRLDRIKRVKGKNYHWPPGTGMI